MPQTSHLPPKMQEWVVDIYVDESGTVLPGETAIFAFKEHLMVPISSVKLPTGIYSTSDFNWSDVRGHSERMASALKKTKQVHLNGFPSNSDIGIHGVQMDLALFEVREVSDISANASLWLLCSFHRTVRDLRSLLNVTSRTPVLCAMFLTSVNCSKATRVAFGRIWTPLLVASTSDCSSSRKVSYRSLRPTLPMNLLTLMTPRNLVDYE